MQGGDAPERFVSEALTPAAGTADTSAMARGEPGLPARFLWRGRHYSVAGVLSRWKTSGPGKGGARVYLRRHWWRLVADDGTVMTVYCQRTAEPGRGKRRWWLYSIGGR